MSKKRGFDQDDGPAPEQKSQGLGCCADGCPLVGTISPSTSGGNWRCWAHDRLQEPSQWGYLTGGITANLWLFKLADRINTMPLGEMEGQGHKITAFLEAKGRPDLVRLKDAAFDRTASIEPRHAWVMRLRNAAYAAAFAMVEQNWTGPKPGTVRQKMRELTEALTA